MTCARFFCGRKKSAPVFGARAGGRRDSGSTARRSNSKSNGSRLRSRRCSPAWFVRSAVTDINGAFTIAPLDDGLYRVQVTLPGFKQAKVEHLQLKAGEVTHAIVALKMDITDSITVGILADPMMMNEGRGVGPAHTDRTISTSTCLFQNVFFAY